MKTKVEVVKNFYTTAEKSSSSPELVEEFKLIINNLLWCNGYTDPRSFKDTHIRIPKADIIDQDEKVCLKIPYVSEYVSYEILRYIRKRKLPISVIFTPGRKLCEIFCTSRPLDKPSCSSTTCNICQRLEDNVDCRTTHPVYQITCMLCNQIYCGVSSRSLNERLSEHWRFASNPDKPSYREEALQRSSL